MIWVKGPALIATFVFLYFSACGVAGIGVDSKSSDTSSDESSDDGSLAEGSFQAGQAGSLSAPTDSVIAGASIDIPAGALSIDTSISMAEGASIANESIATELGITTDVSSAGPSTNLDTDVDVSADNPFTLSLPLDGASLALVASCETSIAVVYHQKRVEAGAVKLFFGIMPYKELLDNTIKVDVKHFGSYQPACVEEEITEEKSSETTTPIVRKVKSNKFIGFFLSECEEDNRDGGPDDNSGNNDPTGTGGGDNSNDNGGGGGGPGGDIEFPPFEDQTSSEFQRFVEILQELGGSLENDIPSEGSDDMEYFQRSLRLSKDRFSYKEIRFLEKREINGRQVCRRPVSSNTISGSYTNPGEIDEDTKKIDVKFETFEVKPLNKFTAAVWNWAKACDKEDWDVGVAKSWGEDNRCEEFTEREDDGSIRQDGPNPGNEVKSIIQVKDANGRTEMRLGDQDSRDEEGRENKVSENEVFYKVD